MKGREAMDDLYNAVEDVKLINAMTDEPRPTKEWVFPSAIEVRQQIEGHPSLHSFPFIVLSIAGLCDRLRSM